MLKHPSRPARLRGQRGLSIIELMVGIALGLFLIGGAVKLFTDYLGSSRRSLLDIRLHQDLRAAADLVARDLRRAGYWRNATDGVWSAATTSVAPNLYTTITLTQPVSAGDPTIIAYNYDKDGTDGIDTNTERFGFRLDAANGVLQASLGNNTYQAITDASTVNITGFTVAELSPARTAELFMNCPCLTSGKCLLSDFAVGGSRHATRPLLTIQQYVITLTGQSRNDTTVTRSLRETVRVRNDRFTGDACVN